MFSLHIRNHLYPDVEALLERLDARRDEIAEHMAATLRREVAEFPGAQGPAADETALCAHGSHHVEAFLAAARTGKIPTGAAVACTGWAS